MKTQNIALRSLLLGGIVCGFSLSWQAGAQYTAFDIPAPALGNEKSGPNPICSDFRVLRPIEVSELGVFDSGGNGIAGTAVITVQLCESSPYNKGRSPLETLRFDAASPGTLRGGYRFKPLARPIELLPGHYSLDVSGFDANNPENNGAIARNTISGGVQVNDGGGLIWFLGCHHRNDLTLRSRKNKNMGPPGRFAAATFVYAAAQLPPNPYAQDYAALVAGVKTFPIDHGKKNYPDGVMTRNRYGSIALWNEAAFPVIVEPSGNRLVFEAGGVYKGDPSGARCVAFAHEQFGHEIGDARMVLFENAIKWAARKNNPANIVIALSTNLNANYFRSRGYQVQTADPGMKMNDPNSMPGSDVLVVDFHGPYTQRFMTRAADFAAHGGGLVITFLPWNYVHREIKPRFLRVNALIAPFGLAYRSSLVRPVDYGFTNIQEVPYPPELFEALPTAELLRKNRLARIRLGGLERSVAMNTLAYAGDAKPDLIKKLTDAYSGAAEGATATLPSGGGEFADVSVMRASQADNSRLGSWQREKDDLVAMSPRGSVEYRFQAQRADIYKVIIDGTQNLDISSRTNFELTVSLDGLSLGRHQLHASFGKAGELNVTTPFIKPGSHRLRILWDNARSFTQLRLEQVRVEAASGADSNGNGITDWVEARVNQQSGLDGTNETIRSYTSPVCLEGHDPYPALIKADVSGANVNAPKIQVHPAPNGEWYVNVPLASVRDTVFRVSYQNGAKTEMRSLRWIPYNVMDGGELTLRKGDSLLLTTTPPGAAASGTMQFAIGTNSYPERNATSPLQHEFNRPGTVTVTGSHTSDAGLTRSGSVTVNVVGQTFSNNPACWVGRQRDWQFTLPPGAVFETDARLITGSLVSLADGVRQTKLLVDDNVPRSYVTRLGQDGPILDSGAAEGFYFWQGKDTYTRCLKQYQDGSELVAMLLVMSPVLPGVKVKVNLIVGGVVFEDGTITKTLTSADFDSLGRCVLKFIRPASAKTSVCHSIQLFQGNTQIGYIQ